MNLSKTMMNVALATATGVSLGTLAANATASSDARPSILEPAKPVQTKEVSGEITEVGESQEFVLTDAMDKPHSLSTNEKTIYTLDGEQAIRKQVVARGANVEAKVNDDGVALSINRISN